MTTLPQISLAKLSADATRREEQQHLRATCEEYGFFYLIEHGIPKEQIAEAIDASRRFFKLPQSVKERYGQAAQDVYPATARGYSPFHGEVLHPDTGPDPKELFDLGVEDEYDRRHMADSRASRMTPWLLVSRETCLLCRLLCLTGLSRSLGTRLPTCSIWNRAGSNAISARQQSCNG
ncbi:MULTISPECIES: 2-oxoglutarate and iron-dependent oxygenase domain-containing protein [Mesorhizobium]|uniref:2-oxoglutarate and iron-dependent oxygenase domain-containing protein n=1 Tax=Mesorhizobium TaxID=68287 RepID=UPI001FD9C521|nr:MULTISPECIES: 2-oxoglutarate and iron-dependent oxygenase domain-containing protein [Mesorhizobium]WJI38387.1 2-oxoglutarate and iron-dependent oxygenase domain-containing protein [Mesorhizobium opportunistum]